MSSTHEAFVPGDVVCPVCGSGLAIRWKEPAAEPIRQDHEKTLTCLTIQGTVEAMEQEPYSSQRRIAWRGEEIIEALMDNPQFLRDIGLDDGTIPEYLASNLVQAEPHAGELHRPNE